MWWVAATGTLLVIGWVIVSARRALYPELQQIPPPDPLPSYSTHAVIASDGTSVDVWRLTPPSPLLPELDRIEGGHVTVLVPGDEGEMVEAFDAGGAGHGARFLSNFHHSA